jgi:acyl phosphate:glycerol-3-phosphate acyltransferase
MITLLLIAAISYLLGSIPFGYLLVRIFRGEDVRLSGSGNIGATNVSRKSPLLGVMTLLLDALKGTIAVLIAHALSSRTASGASLSEYLAVAALFAIIGHIFPVWLHFRGGKGVATGLGAFLPIAPKAVLIAIAAFVLLVVAFRHVSLGSICSVAGFPFIAWKTNRFSLSAGALILIALSSLLIVAKHHENIRRLLAGTENRIGSKHI